MLITHDESWRTALLKGHLRSTMGQARNAIGSFHATSAHEYTHMQVFVSKQIHRYFTELGQSSDITMSLRCEGTH
jgi:hypothetical protein